MEYLTKNLCVSKKWWKHHKLGLDQESDITSSHWSNHSNNLLVRKVIDLKSFNSADNKFHTLYNHLAYKNGDKSFLLFNNKKKKFVSGCIKEVSRSNVNKNEVDRIIIISKGKAMMEAENNIVPNRSGRQADV